MGMSSVYEVRGGVRIKEEGRTTFVEVEMDITQPEGVRELQAGVTCWSTTGKWEDAACSGPAFASQVRSGIEEALWRSMESAPSLQALDCLPSPRAARPHGPEKYKQPATTPTAGTEIISYPRSPNDMINAVSRTVSEVTDMSGASTATVVGDGPPTLGDAGDVLTRESTMMIDWSLPSYDGWHWPAHLL